MLEKMKFLEKGDVVLNLGSSSGEYLIDASKIAAKVYGIELSKEFENVLKRIEKKHENIKVIMGNVFTIEPKLIGENVDVILNTLNLDVLTSFQALSRFLPILKPHGKILMLLKLKDRRKKEVEEITRRFAGSLQLRILDFFDEFVLMKKIKPQ